jgi:subtilisin family serine protease
MKNLIEKLNSMLQLLTLFAGLCFNTNNVNGQTTPNPYLEVQTDEAGNPLYYKHQIIIAFKPDLMNINIINNKEFLTGNLSDFFTDEAKKIASNSGIWSEDVAKATTSKIYPFFDADDTLSLTRSGETITIPKYWATLLIYWPLNDERTVLEVCQTLKMYYPIIEFAHPNYLYKQNNIPNDYFYYQQYSLRQDLSDPFNKKEGNINMENAWDIEVGSPEIKLGIFDDPIVFTHSDFGGGTLASSKIKGGQVYYNNTSTDINKFNITQTAYNHGTKVAGVAAAIRNNEIGIAGVAGGDYLQNNMGTSLYTFGIFGDPITQIYTPPGQMLSTYCGDALATPAITLGATYTRQPNGSYTGYGLDIQNHSWGGGNLSDNMRRAIKGAARNNCVLVCSRGNNNKFDNNFGTDKDNFPACYNDEWVISVGASGTNRKRLNIQVKNVGGGAEPWSSMYGKNMDVLAPGSETYVFTTIDEDVENKDPNGNKCIWGDYCNFNGTSAAAPHVSGLAALLLSKYRLVNGFTEKLEPEDIENLIEKYALHQAPSPALFDNDQGWGLINPENTLDKIKNNQFRIFHFNNGQQRTETNMGNITITIPAPTNGAGGLFGLAAGNYIVEKWRIVETFTNTFGTSEQILGYWPRLNATIGLKDFSSNSVTDDEHASYSFSQTGRTLNVQAITYAYKNIITGQWLNIDKNKVKTAYTVHTFDPSKNAINEISQTKTSLRLYPNPAQNNTTIELDNNKLFNIEVFDLNGKNQPISFLINAKNAIINTELLPNGIYICKTMLVNGSIAINKLIISK